VKLVRRVIEDNGYTANYLQCEEQGYSDSPGNYLIFHQGKVASVYFESMFLNLDARGMVLILNN
jgi:hypothetical protein